MSWRCVLVSLFAALLAAPALAETLEEVTVRTDGPDVVAEVRFNARVRFLRQAPVARGALFTITFDIVAADEEVLSQTVQESKRLPRAPGLPEGELTYVPTPGRGFKTLVLGLRTPAEVRVRQGASSRAVELVFVGAAQAPGAAPAASAASAAAPQAPASAAVSPAAPAPASAPSAGQAAVDARAADLMTKAKAALTEGRLADATDALNQLLLLPPNAESQEAQELIGLAWERAGDVRRARVEYELYLRLYPEGEASRRVAQRLAALSPPAGAGAAGAPAAPGSAPAGAPLTPESGTAAAAERRFTGNIAQYYYGGKAKSQSLVNIASGIDQQTLTRTNESAIVTSVDLGGRFAGTESETRVVVRGTGAANLTSASHNDSVLSAAYVDYRRTASGIAVRLGRQSPISGGLLGFFDGVSMTYPISTGWKFDLMGGVPANPPVSAPAERLAAAVLEADGILEKWGGNVYLIDQTTEGIANRRAVGGEVRYSGEVVSTYTLVDYDVLFRKLNAFSLQGSVQVPSQTTVTFLLDSRKAPSLQTSNALISTGASSLKTLLETMSIDEVRAAALATTADARQALLSASRPLSEKWQLTGDLRWSSIGALPAVGNFEATPATGNQYGATLQVTGSNLYSGRDINNFNLGVLTSPHFHGAQIGYNNLSGLRGGDVVLEPSLRLYTQRDDQGIRLNRVTPGLRTTYRLSRRASLLGEGVVEHSTTHGPSSHDTTDSVFFYVGYRYDLF
ncbi:MAG TPA: hypothetical protein VMU47_02010 [Caldimonas sp.]|nr:hypothetical protein [Caldimonas sp.]